MATNRITYGTYTFEHPSFTVDERVIYAEDLATQIGIQYSFRVTGYMIGDGTASGLVNEIAAAHCQLEIPRQEFKVQWSEDGAVWDTLYDIVPQTNEIAWGPQPDEVGIQRIFGGRSAMYSFTLRATVKECYGDGCAIQSRGNEILAVTRKFGHQYDHNGMCTRTVSGKLKLTSGAVASGLQADQYRDLCILPLPRNFQRTSQNFEQSADGTELQFTFTDHEQYLTLPTPITGGNATYQVQCSLQNGALYDHILAGRFEAPAGVAKSVILQRITDLAATKFPTSGQLIFVNRSLTEDVFNNAINFSLHVQSTLAATGTDPFNFYTGLASFGAAPPTSTGAAQWISAYGSDGNTTSGVIASVPTIWNACTGQSSNTSNPSSLPASTQASDAGSDGTDGTPQQTIQSPTNTASTEHQENPYTYWHEELAYEVNNHVKQLAAKLKGTDPVVMQTASPTVTIIEVGMADRIGAPPQAPPPIYTNADAVQQQPMIATSITPFGPENQIKYSIRWRYVSAYRWTVASMDDVGVVFQSDPRLTSTAQKQDLQNPPEGLIYVEGSN